MVVIDMFKTTEAITKEMRRPWFLAINKKECEESNEDKKIEIEIGVVRSLKKTLTNKTKEETIKKLLQDNIMHIHSVSIIYRANKWERCIVNQSNWQHHHNG